MLNITSSTKSSDGIVIKQHYVIIVQSLDGASSGIAMNKRRSQLSASAERYRPGAQKFYSREKGQSPRPHELIPKNTSISKMDCCGVLCMTFTSKSTFLLCIFLHLFKDIAPRLKLVLNDSLAPLEFRMPNDSNCRCDLLSDSSLGI